MQKINLTQFLKENKEGLIIGAVVGFVIGKWLLPSSFDLTPVAESQGIIDTFKSAGTTAIEFARTKIIWATTLLGTAVGGLIDSLFKEGYLMNKLRRWF